MARHYVGISLRHDTIDNLVGDQGVVFRGGLWSALQPTNLALKGAHSTLVFYHDGKDLA
jgi:hypothetical protein